MRAKTMAIFAASAFLLSATLIAGEIDLKDVKCMFNPKGAAKAETGVAYGGGKVFFCCNNCKAKFEKSPEKFTAVANHQLVASKQAKQVACPLSGQPVNAEKTVKIGGVEVGFCCGNCEGKAKKAEGAKQVELAFGKDAFKKGFKVSKAD